MSGALAAPSSPLVDVDWLQSQQRRPELVVLDARVDARLATHGHGRTSLRGRPRGPAFFALATMVTAIPLSAIAVASGSHPAGFWGLLVVWIGVITLNVVYISRWKPPSSDRY